MPHDLGMNTKKSGPQNAAINGDTKPERKNGLCTAVPIRKVYWDVEKCMAKSECTDRLYMHD
jgi:hypothetical protein